MKAKDQIMPFQVQGAKEGYERKRYLLADEMGMFKTSQSIFVDSKVREKDPDMHTLAVVPNSVKEHWQKEIGEWQGHAKPRVQIIEARTFEEDVQRAKDADWSIIGYPVMSAIGSENGRGDELKSVGFSHVILDEVHNAKNPAALRTKQVKAIADDAEYLSALSGTPMPNTVVDLYMLFSFLDPVKYPVNFANPREMQGLLSRFYYMYRKDPRMVRNMLHEKMIRREAKDYIQAKLPQAHEHDVFIDLTGDHAAVYYEILGSDMPFGRKLMQLEKAALDPSLVDPALIENPNLRRILQEIESQKYLALDKLIEEEADNNGKVLVFTNLKTGVVEKLRRRYVKYGVLVIDGDVSSEARKGADSDRERIRKSFQYDPHYRLLIATTTMNEGVDLTAATAVAHLGIPWTPAEILQRNARSKRYGEIEKDELDIHTLIARTEDAESIDEAMIGQNRDKETKFRFMVSGIKLTKADFEEMQEAQKTRRVKDAGKSVDQRLLEHFIRFRGKGVAAVQRYLEQYPDASKRVAELYPKFRLAQNAAAVYAPLLRELEATEPLPTKVDLACGPGMLGISLQEPTLGFDIDRNMLEVGRGIYPQNQLAEGTMDKIPLDDGKADALVCSLAYQMTNPKTGERERTLRQMNRVLRPNGKAIIVLNDVYLDQEDDQRFKEAAAKLGFEAQPEYTGLRQSGKSGFRVYTFSKVGQPQAEPVDASYFTFKGDIPKYRQKRV